VGAKESQNGPRACQSFAPHECRGNCESIKTNLETARFLSITGPFIHGVIRPWMQTYMASATIQYELSACAPPSLSRCLRREHANYKSSYVLPTELQPIYETCTSILQSPVLVGRTCLCDKSSFMVYTCRAALQSPWKSHPVRLHTRRVDSNTHERLKIRSRGYLASFLRLTVYLTSRDYDLQRR
jgi:hypothetical protein